jgi:hypothetical protein
MKKETADKFDDFVFNFENRIKVCGKRLPKNIFIQSKTISGKEYSSYTAVVFTENGKINKSFSIQKYGEIEAFNLICEWVASHKTKGLN